MSFGLAVPAKTSGSSSSARPRRRANARGRRRTLIRARGVYQATTAWLIEKGIGFATLDREYGYGLAIVSVECKYRAPVHIEQTVEVHLAVRDLTRRGFTTPFQIVRVGIARPEFVRALILDTSFGPSTGGEEGVSQAGVRIGIVRI